MFSITICTHNRCSLLKKMIASIENQSFKNYEIIIVNDYSTDDTNKFLNILKKNSKFKIINNDSNIGLQSSRIKAADQAKYEYIIQLDKWFNPKVHHLCTKQHCSRKRAISHGNCTYAKNPLLIPQHTVHCVYLFYIPF